jgi:hypothetical protein
MSGAPRIQLNVFYGQTIEINPASINQKIDDLNLGASKSASKIKSTSLMGAETLAAVIPGQLFGVRYTSQRADSGQGTKAGGINQIRLDVQDISGVWKLDTALLGFRFNLGATAGVSLVNNMTVNTSGTIERYSSPGGLVLRGFVGTRYSISMFSVFAEGGYQSLKDKAYKNPRGAQPTSTSGEVTLDLSGPYAVGGLGLNF